MADIRSQVAASPDASDFVKEARADVVHHADGSWTATVRGDENIARAVAMQGQVRALDVERGAKIAASRPTERVVNKHGREMDYPAHLTDQVKDKAGFKPRRYYGRVKERWVVRGGEMVRVI